MASAPTCSLLNGYNYLVVVWKQCLVTYAVLWTFADIPWNTPLYTSIHCSRICRYAFMIFEQFLCWNRSYCCSKVGERGERREGTTIIYINPKIFVLFREMEHIFLSMSFFSYVHMKYAPQRFIDEFFLRTENSLRIHMITGKTRENCNIRMTNVAEFWKNLNFFPRSHRPALSPFLQTFFAWDYIKFDVFRAISARSTIPYKINWQFRSKYTNERTRKVVTVL